MEKFKKRLIACEMADEEDFEGFTKSEVWRIERFYRIRLPEAHKAFLRVFGRKGSDFAKELGHFTPSLFEMRVFAEELLEEEDFPFRLSEYDYVMGFDQYRFWFFNAKESDNPSVHYFEECESGPVQTDDSYIEFLERWVSHFENRIAEGRFPKKHEKESWLKRARTR